MKRLMLCNQNLRPSFWIDRLATHPDKSDIADWSIANGSRRTFDREASGDGDRRPSSQADTERLAPPWREESLHRRGDSFGDDAYWRSPLHDPRMRVRVYCGSQKNGGTFVTDSGVYSITRADVNAFLAELNRTE